MQSPFERSNETGFGQWADWKRERALTGVDQSVVEVADGANLTGREIAKLADVCSRSNFVIYRSRKQMDERAVLALGKAVGLLRIDRNLCADESGVSRLQVVEGGVQGEYIPYTNRSLNWHTDGYYNTADNPIRGFVLHCVAPAPRGGGNELIDPEMLYLRLREQEPGLIEELERQNAMTVPANESGGEVIRGETTGPVYWRDPHSGDLMSRYTARKRHIRWMDTLAFGNALGSFERAIADATVPVYRYRLDAGEGMICNNVLHTRQPFDDDESSSRCMLRARYHDRVRGTGIKETYLRR